MSSTNKTANYQLSQFVGTDIPSILNDYNGDMRKIDSAIKDASVAGGDNATAIAELQTSTARMNTEIGGINSTVNTLSGKVVGIEEVIPATASAQNKLLTAQELPEIPSITELEEEVSDISADVKAIQLCVPSNASESNKFATVDDIGGSLILNIPADEATTNSDAIARIKTAIVGFNETDLLHTTIVDGNSRAFKFSGLFQNGIHFIFENCSGSTNDHIGVSMVKINIPLNNNNYEFESVSMGANYNSSTQEDVPYYSYSDLLNNNNIGFKVYK